MAITKKVIPSKKTHSPFKVSTQEQPLVLCFIYKILHTIQLHSLSVEDEFDDRVLVRSLVSLGMPRRLVSGLSNLDLPKFLSKGNNLKKSSQLKWLTHIIDDFSLSTLTNAAFYRNIRTLTKGTNNPRVYFRLYLFCYLKQASSTFNNIIHELLPNYSRCEDSNFLLLTLLDITESEIQEVLFNNHDKEKTSESLLLQGDKSLQHKNVSFINIDEFLKNIELPDIFVSVIKKHSKLESVEHLIRECYQLNSDTELTPLDFSPTQFLPLQQYLKHAISSKHCGVNILLHGEPGVGKTMLVKTLTKALNCDLFDISRNSEDRTSNNKSQNMADELLRTQALCAPLNNIILLVDECDDFFYESSATGRSIRKHKINQMLESSIKPTIWITNSARSLEDAYLRRFDMVLEIKSPEPKSYEKKVRELSKGLRLSTEFIKHICDQPNISIAHIKKAIKVTKALCLTATKAQQQIGVLLNGYLIAGHYPKLKPIQKSSQLVYDLSLTHCSGHNLETVQKGVERLGESRILLYGPPGTGKSAYAKYLANKVNMPLISKKASDLLGSFVGETEQKIAAAFEQAKESNSVLLIDEVDSFLNSREGHQQSWESTMVNEMLTQMESFDGIFIATTNFNKKLDHAVARRFDFKIKLDYLLPEQSLKLFENLVPKASNKTKEQLCTLTNLTAGDFTVVERKLALLGNINEDETLALLIQESNYKHPQSKPIGFI